ncbi:MAG: hypothetical protein IJV04_10540 [Lachnospiraceae bacterium]|nr:hypothetical protein [Lachnospiraceae bacterium]
MRPSSRALRKKRDTGVIRVVPTNELIDAIHAENRKEEARRAETVSAAMRAEEEAREWEAERGNFVAEEIEREARRRKMEQERQAERAKDPAALLVESVLGERKAEPIDRSREAAAPERRSEQPVVPEASRPSARVERPSAPIRREEPLMPERKEPRNARRDEEDADVIFSKPKPRPVSRREFYEKRERQRRQRVRKKVIRIFMRVLILAVVLGVGLAVAMTVYSPSRRSEKKSEDIVSLPPLVTRDLKIGYGRRVDPEDFLKKYKEGDGLTYSFETEPDSTLLKKKQSVVIQAEDEEGNLAVGNAHLSVVEEPGSVEVEAGSEPEAVKEAAEARFGTSDIEGLEYVQTNHVDRFGIRINKEGTSYSADVSVVDTVAPVFSVRDMKCSTGYEADAKDFVTESDDATDIAYSFEHQPDTSVKGRHALVVIGKDEGGNQCRHTAFLVLGKDKEGPVFEKAEDFTSFVGDSITYKDKVVVVDNFDSDVDIEVDTSEVDPTREGTYPVTYTATDAAGNSTEATLNITLTEYTAEEQEVVKKADEIIDSIITDDMSDRDKAWAIYEYIRDHVSYVSTSEKGDYLKAARQGLVNGSGDCYVYFSVAKLLLDEAGITNMDIERIPHGDDMHYWNLVDVHDGHGWYHYDTTPRVDHPTIFLWDDAETKAYSDAHNNCHNYDRTKYPVIP